VAEGQRQKTKTSAKGSLLRTTLRGTNLRKETSNVWGNNQKDQEKSGKWLLGRAGSQEGARKIKKSQNKGLGV